MTQNFMLKSISFSLDKNDVLQFNGKYKRILNSVYFFGQCLPIKYSHTFFGRLFVKDDLNIDALRSCHKI